MMTTEEFSNELDVLVNSWDLQVQYGVSHSPIVLDEYEKSVVLTKAQTELVLELYKKFEQTEEMTEYLSPLVKQVTLTVQTEGSSFGKSSVFFSLPEDIWFKTGETAVISDDSLSCGESIERTVDVVPVTQDEWYRTISSPFRGSNERRVLRMSPSEDKAELFSKYNIVSYTVRYLAHPEPIILQNLPEELSIDGKNTEQTCLLKESLHREILERAAAIALRTKTLYSTKTENNR